MKKDFGGLWGVDFGLVGKNVGVLSNQCNKLKKGYP